jgi:hypothetical protein
MGPTMLRKKPVMWLGVLLLAVLGWLALVVTSHGLLIRHDPMARSASDSPFVQDIACTYSSGVRTVTVLSLGNTEAAECSQLYKFGSTPACPSVLIWPSVCEAGPGQ